MLTLLTALALNIPGNPIKFECNPVDMGVRISEHCIKVENQYMSYLLTFECIGGSFLDDEKIIVIPKAEIVLQGEKVFNCTINKVESIWF